MAGDTGQYGRVSSTRCLPHLPQHVPCFTVGILIGVVTLSRGQGAGGTVPEGKKTYSGGSPEASVSFKRAGAGGAEGGGGVVGGGGEGVRGGGGGGG